MLGGRGRGRGCRTLLNKNEIEKQGISCGSFPVTHDHFLEIFELIIKESRKHSALVSIIPLLHFSLVYSIIHTSCLFHAPDQALEKTVEGAGNSLYFSGRLQICWSIHGQKAPHSPILVKIRADTDGMSIHQLHMVFNIKILIWWLFSARVMS